MMNWLMETTMGAVSLSLKVTAIVVALMLADARHVVQGDPSVRSGKWEKKKFMGREISGKTVGIVGLGYIGQMVIRRLRGF